MFSLPFVFEAPPLGPEADCSNRTNSSIGHHHFNDNQPDKRQLCRDLTIFIPVGKPNLPDISNQDTRASIDLPQQPQNALAITTTVVMNMIQEGNKGS